MPTIRNRGPLQWQAIVKRRGWPSQTKTFLSRRDAERWARRVESEMDSGRFVPRDEAERTLLRDAIHRYLEEVTPTKRGAPQERYRMKVLLESPLAKLSLAAIRPVDVGRWAKQRQQTVTGNTVRHDLAALSAVYQACMLDWSIPVTNPVRGIRRPPPGRSRERRLLPGEESWILTAARDYPNAYLEPFIRLALETACRRGALLSARWQDADLASRTLVLRATKTGHTREVGLSTSAVATLRSMPRSLDGRIFPVPPATVSVAFHAVVQRARARYMEDCQRSGATPDPRMLVDLRLHDLRHEATSRLFERGLDVMEVAAMTGHRTLAMLQRYTHLRATHIAQKLG